MELFGRKTLYYSKPLDSLEQVVDALNVNYIDHTLNVTEIDYLWKYYLGRQNIIDRQKKVRSDIIELNTNLVLPSIAMFSSLGMTPSISS